MKVCVDVTFQIDALNKSGADINDKGGGQANTYNLAIFVIDVTGAVLLYLLVQVTLCTLYLLLSICWWHYFSTALYS